MIRTTLLAGAAMLALGACGAGGTAAPTTEADKTKMATEIATLMTDPKMIDQMFDAMGATAIPDMSSMCAAAPADKQAECQAGLANAEPIMKEAINSSMEKAKGLMPDLMGDMGAIMAKLYTGPELAKMKDFYASPEGKSIMQKQPQVMAEFMPKVMERMEPMQMEMMKELQDKMTTVMPPAPVTPPAPN